MLHTKHILIGNIITNNNMRHVLDEPTAGNFYTRVRHIFV